MPALWMLLGSFFFATMAVGIKFAAVDFSTSELVLYRGMVSVIFVALLLRSRGISFKTPLPMMHAWRSLIGVLSLGAWFYAIANLPLATAMTLNYMSGVWMAVFVVAGALLYGRSESQGPLSIVLLTSFLGVIMILRPTLDQDQLFAGLIGLFSGLGAAIAYLQVAALGKAGEPEGRTVFYFSLATAVSGLLGTLLTGFTPWFSVRWQSLAWLVPIGLLATLGQWCMTTAYSRGPTLLVANLQYSGIVFSTIYGLILFGDRIPFSGWAGMLLVVLGAIVATTLRAQLLPVTSAEER